MRRVILFITVLGVPCHVYFVIPEPRTLETKHVPKGHLAVLENPGAGSTDDAKVILVPHYKVR